GSLKNQNVAPSVRAEVLLRDGKNINAESGIDFRMFAREPGVDRLHFGSRLRQGYAGLHSRVDEFRSSNELLCAWPQVELEPRGCFGLVETLPHRGQMEFGRPDADHGVFLIAQLDSFAEPLHIAAEDFLEKGMADDSGVFILVCEHAAERRM